MWRGRVCICCLWWMARRRSSDEMNDCGNSLSEPWKLEVHSFRLELEEQMRHKAEAKARDKQLQAKEDDMGLSADSPSLAKNVRRLVGRWQNMKLANTNNKAYTESDSDIFLSYLTAMKSTWKVRSMDIDLQCPLSLLKFGLPRAFLEYLLLSSPHNFFGVFWNLKLCRQLEFLFSEYEKVNSTYRPCDCNDAFSQVFTWLSICPVDLPILDWQERFRKDRAFEDTIEAEKRVSDAKQHQLALEAQILAKKRQKVSKCKSSWIICNLELWYFQSTLECLESILECLEILPSIFNLTLVWYTCQSPVQITI